MAKVCVIGCGVVGAATARALACDGHDVLVLDAAEGPALGTSFANGGQLSYSYVEPLAGPGVLVKVPGWLARADAPVFFRPSLDPGFWRWLTAFVRACNAPASARTTAELLALSFHSRERMMALLAEGDLAFDRTITGKLVVHRHADAFAQARAQAALQRRLGSEQFVLSRRDCVDQEPCLASLAERLVGGVFTPSEETGDCHAFTSALVKRTPATFRFGVAVRGFHSRGGAITAVATSEGEVEADHFVLAAGLESRTLARPLGIDLPLIGLRGYSLTMARTATFTLSTSVTDAGRKIVYAPLGARIRAAAMVDVGPTTVRRQRRRLAALGREVQATFPGADAGNATAWIGVRPATPTGRPLIGPTRCGNLWLNVGHGALGFTLALGSASLLADLLAGREPAIGHRAFTLGRERETRTRPMSSAHIGRRRPPCVQP